MWSVIELTDGRVQGVFVRNEYETAVDLALEILNDQYDPDEESAEDREIHESYHREAVKAIERAGIWSDGSYMLQILQVTP